MLGFELGTLEGAEFLHDTALEPVLWLVMGRRTKSTVRWGDAPCSVGCRF